MLLVLTHRYVTGKCCQDPAHITNFDEADYRQVLESAIDNAAKVLAEAAWLPNHQVIDHMEGFKMVDGLPTSSAGLPIWPETEPVHLSRAAYRDIWLHIQRAANAGKVAAADYLGKLKYESIVNNGVDRQMETGAVVTSPWLLGKSASGTPSDSWADQRSLAGSTFSRRGGGGRRPRHTPY